MTGPSEEWVADLWRKMKPAARAQVRVLASALSELRADHISSEARQQAWWESHRLAGSLGSYGFEDAAEAAEQMAALLEGDDPIELDQALRLLVRLNAVVAEPTPG